MLITLALALLAQSPGYDDYLGEPPTYGAYIDDPAITPELRAVARDGLVRFAERARGVAAAFASASDPTPKPASPAAAPKVETNDPKPAAAPAPLTRAPADDRRWVIDTAHPGWQGFGRIRNGYLVDVSDWRRIAPQTPAPAQPLLTQPLCGPQGCPNPRRNDRGR